MKSAFSLCFFTFLSFSAFAQNVFVPALVFVDNDTLDGLVMRPSTTKGKDLIFFTEFEGGPSLSFKADEIEGYKVKGKSRFLSAVVEMNLASIGEPNKILDTIFVEVLVSGKANLFRYHDNSKDHFFIGKDTISMQELIFSHQEGGEADSTEKFAFKKQLSQSLADCEAAVNLVQTTSFNANELMALFHMYNTCFGKQD